MADPIRIENRIYTFADYMTWSEDELWEIIDGVPYNMAPPGTKHQRISRRLMTELDFYLKDKKCEAFAAPFGVRFPTEDEPDDFIKDALMPDITVVCDKKKLDDKGCRGAPDFIIEILSPSTAKRDLKAKRLLYQKSGVREYWVIDPLHNTIQVFKLNKDGRYDFPEIYAEDDIIKVGIFDNELEIYLEIIFAE